MKREVQKVKILDSQIQKLEKEKEEIFDLNVFTFRNFIMQDSSIIDFKIRKKNPQSFNRREIT